MKTTTPLLPLHLAFLIFALGASGQGAFRNLNFEQATIVPSGPGQPLPLVVASSALPFWTAYIGSMPMSDILYDDLTIGSPAVSIHDGGSPFRLPLDGNYSVVIQHSSGGNPASASIGQVGQLPGNALSLVFDTVNFQNLLVTFDGNPVPLVQIGSTAHFSVLAGDISSYAGQTGELLFTGLSISGVALDDIRFSTTAVPEPSTLAFFGLAGILYWLYRSRRVQ